MNARRQWKAADGSGVLPGRVVEQIRSGRLREHGFDFLTEAGIGLGEECGTGLSTEVDRRQIQLLNLAPALRGHAPDIMTRTQEALKEWSDAA